MVCRRFEIETQGPICKQRNEKSKDLGCWLCSGSCFRHTKGLNEIKV